MNQPDGRDEMAISQKILNALANDPSAEHIAPLVLETAVSLDGVSAAFLTLFEEPQMIETRGIDPSLLPPVDELQALAATMRDDVHLTASLPQALSQHFSGWAVAPLLLAEKPAGVLGLLFNPVVSINAEVQTVLSAMKDALRIAASHSRTVHRQEKLNRNQNEFVRIVLHDLRSPLTSLKGFASMLESSDVGGLNEKQTHFVSKIMSGIEQMTSFIENTQDAGRYDPETGFYEMERSICDLNDIARQIVNNYIVPAEKQELSLGLSVTDDVPIISADATMLQRAITNLVDNAIKYTPNGGRIEVAVRRVDDEVILSVSDNGYGISDENKKKLFERHFRIRRREHKHVKGGGLGLFIVRSVTQRHGGRAWVESVEGQGSTFFISIPLKGANLPGYVEA